jgi:hypothetical protein
MQPTMDQDFLCRDVFVTYPQVKKDARRFTPLFIGAGNTGRIGHRGMTV